MDRGFAGPMLSIAAEVVLASPIHHEDAPMPHTDGRSVAWARGFSLAVPSRNAVLRADSNGGIAHKDEPVTLGLRSTDD